MSPGTPFRYGQRHAIEVERAREIAAAMGVARHIVVDIDLRAFGHIEDSPQRKFGR